MPGLLVEWSAVASTAWERILLDLAWDGEVREWRDAAAGVRIAAGGTARLVKTEACVVAIEGDVDDSRDAVAIAEAYRRGGVDAAARIEGERAFAVWDERERRMVLVPDGASRRTLAYFWDGSTLLAASRALPIMRDSRVPSGWDGRYLAHAALGTWAPPAGTTAFERVKRVVGGDAVVIERGTLRVVKAGPIVRDAGTGGDPHAAFRAALDRATRARIAGAPPCVALSGGLDSAHVAASMMRSYADGDAFSCVGKQAPGERRLVTLVLTRFPRLTWHPVDCTDAASLFDPPELPLPDDPVSIGPAFQAARLRLWTAMRHAGFRRALDGEGGDELFTHAPGRARKTARSIARGLLASIACRLPIIERKLVLRGISGLWGAPDAHARALVAPDLAAVARARSREERYRLLLRSVAWIGGASARALRAGAIGLELRSPLVDPGVTSVVLASRARSHGGRDKGFLRAAAVPSLPDAVRLAPKTNELYAALRTRALESDEARAELSHLHDDAEVAAIVDVRAVARAHIAALVRPEAAFGAQEDLCMLLRLVRWRRAVRQSLL